MLKHLRWYCIKNLHSGTTLIIVLYELHNDYDTAMVIVLYEELTQWYNTWDSFVWEMDIHDTHCIVWGIHTMIPHVIVLCIQEYLFFHQ